MKKFYLTEELLQVLTYALEDQKNSYVLNTENLVLEILLTENQEKDFWDTHIKLPTWTSADGFTLREQFIVSLKNPYLAEKLSNALHSGKGAFKTFKSVFEEFPLFEPSWKSFKRTYLNSFIKNWYAQLIDDLECESLPPDIEDDYDDVSFDAFSIVEKPFSQQEENLKTNLEKATFDFDSSKNQPKDFLQSIVTEAIHQQQKILLKKGVAKLIAENIEKEEIGIIESYTTTFSEKCIVISKLQITENARGLGIAKKLLSEMIKKIKTADNLIIIWEPYIPSFFCETVKKSGFQFAGGIWLL